MKALAALGISLPLLGLLLLSWGAQPTSYSFPLPASPTFNATEAYLLGRTFAKAFPHKSTGSPDAQAAALWLAGLLGQWGYDVTVQEFTARLGEQVTLRNVLAIRQGQGAEAILILTNYDQAPTATESAYTSAAVGVVLALAHSLASQPLKRGVAFAFVDGEEWGMLGAAYLAQHYPGPLPPSVALVPEYVDVGRALGIAVDPIGQFAGYSPLWLRELIAACAEKEGLAFSQPLGLEEYAQRAVLISFTDQGPLLRQGIAAVQYSTWGDRPELSRQVYHTPEDVYELVTEEALLAYGRVSACALEALEALPSLPRESSYYLATGQGRVGSNVLPLAQAALLGPLYIFALASARRLKREAWREAGCYLAVLAALTGAYALAKALPLLNLLPYYELYPPPPRHPLLYQPAYGAMALWAAALLLGLYGAFRLGRRLRPAPDQALAAEALALALLSLVALALNPFGATFLLLPAAYAWPLMGRGPTRLRRGLALLLFALGGLTIYLLIYVYSQRIYLTLPLMLWYLFMGVSYRLFTPESMLLFLSVLAAGLRLLALAWAPGPRPAAGREAEVPPLQREQLFLALRAPVVLQGLPVEGQEGGAPLHEGAEAQGPLHEAPQVIGRGQGLQRAQLAQHGVVRGVARQQQRKASEGLPPEPPEKRGQVPPGAVDGHERGAGPDLGGQQQAPKGVQDERPPQQSQAPPAVERPGQAPGHHPPARAAPGVILPEQEHVGLGAPQ